MDPMYDTVTLIGAMNLTPRPNRFLRRRLLGNRERTFPTVQVMFDIQKGHKNVAPIVNRRAGGRLIESLNLTSKIYTPPRFRPMSRVTGDDMQMFRLAGEALGGSMSPSERQEQQVAEKMAMQDDMITRAEELMIAQLISTGVVTLTGEDVSDTITVGHTLAGGAVTAWSEAATATPLDDIDAAAMAVLASTGMSPDTVILGATAYAEMMATAQVIAAQNARNWIVLEGMFAVTADGARYVGSYHGMDFFVYPELYYDEANSVDAAMIPAAACIVAVSGERAFGNEMLYGGYHVVKTNQTFESSRIPIVRIDEDANAMIVEVLSHPVPKIADIDSWYIIAT